MATIIAVPTLGAQTLLTNPSDIIAYQIRQFVTTPRSVSNLYYDEVISLNDIISRSAGDPQSVVGPTTTSLQKVFDTIFGSNSSIITVTINQIDAATYALVLSIQIMLNGQAYGFASTVNIVNGSIVMPNDLVPTITIS